MVSIQFSVMPPGSSCQTGLPVSLSSVVIDRPVPYVTPHLAAVEPDLLGDFIGSALGYFYAVSQHGHAQHPSSCRHNILAMFATESCACMKHIKIGFRRFRCFHGRWVRQAMNHIALARRTRVAVCCHHDAQGGAAVPFGLHLVER